MRPHSDSFLFILLAVPLFTFPDSRLLSRLLGFLALDSGSCPAVNMSICLDAECLTSRVLVTRLCPMSLAVLFLWSVGVSKTYKSQDMDGQSLQQASTITPSTS
jgi:hypothetical protein